MASSFPWAQTMHTAYGPVMRSMPLNQTQTPPPSAGAASAAPAAPFLNPSASPPPSVFPLPPLEPIPGGQGAEGLMQAFLQNRATPGNGFGK